MPLKILSEKDRDLILSWRNTPSIRQNMYHSQVITQEEHYAWFERMQADSRSRWYLWYDLDETPNGVVYFTDIDFDHQIAFWGFYARPGAEPGTGTRILYDALELAFDKIGLYKLNSEVIASNNVSIHIHEKFGFLREGVFRDEYFDGKQRVDVIRFGLLAKEWSVARAGLYKSLRTN